MEIHLVSNDVVMLRKQGVCCWRGCGIWDCVDDDVGVGFGGREVWIDEVSSDRTFLPLSFSMVGSPLFGVGVSQITPHTSKDHMFFHGSCR